MRLDIFAHWAAYIGAIPFFAFLTGKIFRVPVRPLLLAGVVIAISGVISQFYGGYIITRIIPAIFNSPWAAIAAIPVSVSLFLLRKYRLHHYAVIEVAGAVTTIFVCAFSTYGSAAQRAAALTGAVYFCIRGLDNADKGDVLGKIRLLDRGRILAYSLGTFCVFLWIWGYLRRY